MSRRRQSIDTPLQPFEPAIDIVRQDLGSLGHAGSDLDEFQWAAFQRQRTAKRLLAIGGHLGRARAAGAGVAGLRTEVAPVLSGLARVMRRVHAQRPGGRSALNVEVAPMADALQFAGESQDLQEMVGNLLDNACKWAHSRVLLSARLEQGRLHIVVEDDGPGLSETERDQVFGRGVRADERVPGTGLGLDITRELAGLYHGEVKLGVARLGGLQAELLLPAPAA